jgi:outer membrane protein, heavy metal efflux system
MRRKNDWIVPILLLSAATASACATVDPRPDYARARDEIRVTAGEEEVFDPEGPVLSTEEIRAMLADGLALDEAGRLALLNNRRLQAGFLGLGVARSDFVQAGLLKNPSLSIAFLFPSGGGRTKWEAELAGNVAELWQIPARKALAGEEVEQRILELSRFAGELVASTKRAYFESVAAREGLAVARADEELARRSLAAVKRQVEMGVATRTEQNLAESDSLRAGFALLEAERGATSAKRELAALLSIEFDLLEVELTDPLPAPIAPALGRESLVQRSLELRPDMRAAGRAIAAAEARVSLEKRRVIQGASLGIAAERPEGGSAVDFLAGPSAALEIPIFDQNQAQVSRAEYHLGEIRKEYEGLAVDVSQQVRAGVDRAIAAANAGKFAQSELIPQAEASAALAQRAFDLSEATVVALLQAQRNALEARRSGIDSLLDAARSRIELERILGAPLEEARGAGAGL